MALQILMIVIVVMLMLGLGGTLTVKSFKRVAVKKNFPTLAIAFISQFGLMPLISFILAIILPVSNAVGLSMVMVGSTPGGSTSNLFTFWSRGDLALSVILTVSSTILAIGMMPLLLLIYSSRFTDDSVKIDYASVILSLLVVLIPVSIGILIRHKSEKIANVLGKSASFIGVVFIGIAIIYGSVSDSRIFDSNWGTFLAAAVMLIVACTFGYFASRLARLRHKYCRTVALETGIQNTTLTLSIISFAFGDDKELRDEMFVFPLLFSFFLVIEAALLTILFRYMSRHEVDEDDEVSDEAFPTTEETDSKTGDTKDTSVHSDDTSVIREHENQNSDIKPENTLVIQQQQTSPNERLTWTVAMEGDGREVVTEEYLSIV